MFKKFKNIISLFLLLVFVLPSILKFEHHHEHFEHKADNGKYYHEHHEKCLICSFEFSIFSHEPEKIVIPKEQPISKYDNKYRSAYFSSLSKYSFLLRAPPIKQI